MSGRDRLKNKFKFKHLLHSLVPSRIRSPSISPSPARDPQASESSTDSVNSNPIHEIPDTQPSIVQKEELLAMTIGGTKEKEEGVIDRVEAPRRMLDLATAGFQDVKTAQQLPTQTFLSNALLKKLPQAKHAAYNSKSYPCRRSCTAKTMEKILADLVAWATDACGKNVYWLIGMAETGKTTTAFTFSQILDNMKMLGASFFCSRSDVDLSNAELIYPTLAHELARHSTAVSKVLLSILEEDRNMCTTDLYNLIYRPASVARAVSNDVFNPRPLIVVIDALDECADQRVACDILETLGQLAPILPLKFFITSRPQTQTQFQRVLGFIPKYSYFTLHKDGEDTVSADIAIYAREELAIIAKERMAGTPISDWPPENRLKTLVRLSGTSFVYAATACKYIGGGGNIVERLEYLTDISQISPNYETSALDSLYGRILSAAFQVASFRERDEIQKVLRAVVSVRTPLSINGLSKLLDIKAENVSDALSPLQSVVYIPENMDLPISTFHAPFIDFITTEKRSRKHFLEPSKSHHMLGLHCLALLQSSLVENICQLEGPSVFNVSQVPSTVKDHIPEALEYACINWAYHVANIKSGGEGEVWVALYRFFDEKLLQWFECLSLLTRLDDGVSSLQRLEDWISSEHNLRNAVVDARQFIMENFDFVNHLPLETYRSASAIVWFREHSDIRWAMYGDKRRSVVREVSLGLRNAWDGCEQILLEDILAL